jgi:hypothetical protein
MAARPRLELVRPKLGRWSHVSGADIKYNSSAAYGAIAHDIIDRLKGFIASNIVHEFRSSNFEARGLGKHALTLMFGRHGSTGRGAFLTYKHVGGLNKA